MSPAAAHHAHRRGIPAGGAHHRGAARTGRGGTLEAVVGGAWEALLDHATAACPICSGPMHQHGAGAAACRSCGTRLS